MSTKLLNSLRLKIETCMELQNGATDEQLQDMLLDVKYLQKYYGTEANGISTGYGQSNIPDVTVSLPLSNEQILKGIQTSPRHQLPKEWLKNEHTNSNYMGGFLNAVKWMEGNAR